MDGRMADARGYALTTAQWDAIPDEWRGIVLRAREDVTDSWPAGTLYTWAGYAAGAGHAPGRLAVVAVRVGTPEATRAARVALLEREVADVERRAARHPEDTAAESFAAELRAWLAREREEGGETDGGDRWRTRPHASAWLRATGSIRNRGCSAGARRRRARRV